MLRCDSWIGRVEHDARWSEGLEDLRAQGISDAKELSYAARLKCWDPFDEAQGQRGHCEIRPAHGCLDELFDSREASAVGEAYPGVASVEVVVRKPNPPVGGPCDRAEVVVRHAP